MKMKGTRSFRLLMLAQGLLVAVGLLVFWSYLWAESADRVASSDVRKPAGGEALEAFWDKFDWEDLTPGEQALWQALGWNRDSWQGEASEPASEHKYWKDLTPAQRTAAGKLGYNQEYWDELLKE